MTIQDVQHLGIYQISKHLEKETGDDLSIWLHRIAKGISGFNDDKEPCPENSLRLKYFDIRKLDSKGIIIMRELREGCQP